MHKVGSLNVWTLHQKMYLPTHSAYVVVYHRLT